MGRVCCLCNGNTDDAPNGEYIELAIRFPDLEVDGGPQTWGAHAACFALALAPGDDPLDDESRPLLPARNPPPP